MSVKIRKDLRCNLAIHVQVHVDACFLLTKFTGENDGCGLDLFKCAVCFRFISWQDVQPSMQKRLISAEEVD